MPTFRPSQALCSAYARWRGAPPTTGEKGLVGGTAALLTMGATMPLENVSRHSLRVERSAWLASVQVTYGLLLS